MISNYIKLKQKIFCYYHNDMDGHCAGTIVKLCEPSAIMIEVQYKKDPMDHFASVVTTIQDVLVKAPMLAPKVYIVDFSFDPKIVQALVSMGCEIVWLDHHKSAIETRDAWIKMEDEINTKPEDKTYSIVKGIQVEDKGAGCALVWKWFTGMDRLPVAVKLVSDYDIWDHSNPNTRAFQAGLLLTNNTKPETSDAIQMWKALIDNDRSGKMKDFNAIDQVLNMGHIAIAAKESYEAKVVKSSYFVEDWQGYRTVAMNSYLQDSYAFDSVLDKYAELNPEVLMWYYQIPNGNWVYSIRNYPGTSTAVNTIAKNFGGGGRPGAAGFQTKELVIKPTEQEDAE